MSMTTPALHFLSPFRGNTVHAQAGRKCGASTGLDKIAPPIGLVLAGVAGFWRVFTMYTPGTTNASAFFTCCERLLLLPAWVAG